MNYKKLIVSLVLPQIAGLIGAISTMPAIGAWYVFLQKPALFPPNWIFGPVWTTLFILMGVAFYLVWNKRGKNWDRRDAIGIFIFQLALNSLWSLIFFGLRSPMAAFFELCVLWLAIIWTIFSFYKISRPAARLLLPYLLWFSFAGYLNFMFWMLI